MKKKKIMYQQLCNRCKKVFITPFLQPSGMCWKCYKIDRTHRKLISMINDKDAQKAVITGIVLAFALTIFALAFSKKKTKKKLTSDSSSTKKVITHSNKKHYKH